MSTSPPPNSPSHDDAVFRLKPQLPPNNIAKDIEDDPYNIITKPINTIDVVIKPVPIIIQIDKKKCAIESCKKNGKKRYTCKTCGIRLCSAVHSEMHVCANNSVKDACKTNYPTGLGGGICPKLEKI